MSAFNAQCLANTASVFVVQDADATGATVSLCWKDQQWMAAMALLCEMQDWKLKADLITYSATIPSCDGARRGWYR